MDLIFAVQGGPNKSQKLPEKVLCSTSSAGLVAFYTNSQKPNNDKFGHFVYVSDLNAPWKCEKITASQHGIIILEWDTSGKVLLTADTSGTVRVWTMKDNLLSTWVEACHVSFPGEQIIRCVFFHNGQKLVLNEKQEANQHSYFEKFIRQRKFGPSVRGFGGVGLEGCLIVTETGMLGTFLLPTEEIAAGPENPIELEAVTESLAVTRNYYVTADVTYSKNGQFLIAVANGKGTGTTMIQGFRVQIQKQQEKLNISTSALPSFIHGDTQLMSGQKLFGLKWSTQDDSDTLVVVSNHATGSLAESYVLKEQSKSLKKLFQANKNDVFKTLAWAPAHQYVYNSHVVAFERSSVPVGPQCTYLATTDGAIHVLKTDCLKEICKTNLNYPVSTENTKQSRTAVKVGALCPTYMGHALLVLDTHGQMFGYRCGFMLREPYLNYIVTALEYSLVNMNDYLDVLLNIKNSTGDAIIDKLGENFNRQQQHLQQYYYVPLQVIKINIYRLNGHGQLKSQDLSNLLMLNSILIAFKSLLRPSELTSLDGSIKDVESNLALALSESVPDVDKVLMNLEAKDFTVETYTLQSLQQLIQWVADLALYILSRLPETRGKPIGYDISRDLVALSCLRELLVMIRIWGLLQKQCLPIFARSSENQEILPALFQILTKLALNPNEPDDLLLDECCTLTQVLAPQVQYIAPRHGLTNPPLNNLMPVLVDYMEDAESLRYYPDIHLLDGSTNSTIIDSVRYMQLGTRPKQVRKCTRCGVFTNMNSVATNKIMKSWEQRWAGCRCNGFWQALSGEQIY